MAEDENIPLDNDSEDQQDDNGNDENGSEENHPFEKKTIDDNIITLSGLYENWFLDYASYVILERAVPSLYDGFKPVQRRIMHSMKELDDGRYNKVANVIGNTMKVSPAR